MPSYKAYPNDRFQKETAIPITHYIEITEGENAGVCFSFGKIEFLGEDEEGNGKMRFDYHLLSCPEHIILKESLSNIEQNIGDILQEILREMVEKDMGEMNKNETGNLNTEQSDS